MHVRVPPQDLPQAGAPFLRRRHSDAAESWFANHSERPLIIEGPPGSGKSTILELLARGVSRGNKVYFSRGLPAFADVAGVYHSQRGTAARMLLAIDDIDAELAAAPERAINLVERWHNELRAVAIVVAVRSAANLTWPQGWIRLALPATLGFEESARLLRLQAGVVPEDIDRLAVAAQGSPLLLRLLSEQALTEPVESILARIDIDLLVSEFPHPEVAHSTPIDIRVRAVNDALIALLSANPDLLYEIRPRQLEELMAELYERQGFEVHLTQETHDGGVDLYVVSYGPFGKAVTLVDTKRNRRDRTVGVGVVRQMYGVVEAKRATAGVIATTSFFSEQAKVFQANVPCRLALRDYVDLRDMLNKASPHR